MTIQHYREITNAVVANNKVADHTFFEAVGDIFEYLSKNKVDIRDISELVNKPRAVIVSLLEEMGDSIKPVDPNEFQSHPCDESYRNDDSVVKYLDTPDKCLYRLSPPIDPEIAHPWMSHDYFLEIHQTESKGECLEASEIFDSGFYSGSEFNDTRFLDFIVNIAADKLCSLTHKRGAVIRQYRSSEYGYNVVEIAYRDGDMTTILRWGYDPNVLYFGFEDAEHDFEGKPGYI